VASWDAGFQQSDIVLNKVRTAGSAPDFVVKFRQKLDSKRALAPDVHQFLQLSLDFPADWHLDVRYFLDLPVCFPFLMVSVGE